MKIKLIVTLLVSLLVSISTFAGDVVVWSLDTHGSIYSSPMIRNGVLYMGNNAGHFYALNSVTGEILWQFETGQEIRSTAAISGDIICVESGKNLFGLNLQGEEQWQFEHSDQSPQGFWEFHHSSPLIVDDVAYVGAEYGKVYGVDIHTGTEVFCCQSPDTQSVIRTTPAIYNGKIYFGNMDGVFFAYDLSTGELVWSYDTKNDKTFSWPNSIQDDVVIHNGAVYFAGKGCVIYALNAETGETIWSWRDVSDQWLIGGPAINGDFLANGSSNQYIVFAFNSNTGEALWETKLDHRVFNAPLIGESNMYVPSGSFYAVDKATGSILQRFGVSGEIFSTPALDNGILYFGTEKGMIHALDETAFLSIQQPDIQVKSEAYGDLGEITPDQPEFQTSFYVYNDGGGPDSLWISKSGTRQVTRALIVEPMEFSLAPGDSQLLQITLDCSGLDEETHNFSIYIKSESDFSAVPANLKLDFSITVVASPSPVDNPQAGQPETFSLSQNYPNPFNPSTTIDFQISSDSWVTCKVYNVRGEEITSLVDGMREKGTYSVSWDAGQLNSGLYVYRLTAGSFTESRKMLLLR